MSNRVPVSANETGMIINLIVQLKREVINKHTDVKPKPNALDQTIAEIAVKVADAVKESVLSSAELSSTNAFI